MGRLYRFELRKLLSNRILLPAFLLGLTLILYNHLGPIRQAGGGWVQGMRDIYRPYEGTLITEEFQKDLESERDRFALAHPEAFQSHMDDEGSVFYYPTEETSYYAGAWEAYGEMIGGLSIESCEETVSDLKALLARGTFDDGRTIPFSFKEIYLARVERGYTDPAVHYAYGWEWTYLLSSTNGISILSLLGLGLIGVFSGESSFRMEGVFLCSLHRYKAAFAKMLAALTFAAGSALLLAGMDLLATALTYGLDGLSLPVSHLIQNNAPFTISGAYALILLIFVAAASSIGALVALSSALSRHATVALLVAGVIIFAQLLMVVICNGTLVLQYPLLDHLQGYANMLPAVVFLNQYQLFNKIIEPKYLWFAFIFPALLTGLLLWLTPKHFLRQRKA